MLQVWQLRNGNMGVNGEHVLLSAKKQECTYYSYTLLSSWMANEHFLRPGKFYNFLLARVERVCPDVCTSTRWRKVKERKKKSKKKASLEAMMELLLKMREQERWHLPFFLSLPPPPFSSPFFLYTYLSQRVQRIILDRGYTLIIVFCLSWLQSFFPWRKLLLVSPGTF